ncbi:hypothetical protein QY97_00789 [Bacillus thermotolerans]|uniref:Uncharacterized protein n=1 Tax=Bacillus thermotolerans TaxID=1221996 RepID=A0A0F5HUU6_BACTR|nr:hypothetical protein QY97_00789 [Bacillus thermotolerans]KKB40631.1 hypothetical protein QY95_01205 [Bacillus thermotolerans]KKB41292.1 hypothetical protein QY96_02094 [Bacillus thermotolerans]
MAAACHLLHNSLMRIRAAEEQIFQNNLRGWLHHSQPLSLSILEF